MYQLTSSDTVMRLADGAIIPPDERNADWRAYQAWLAADNEPQAAPASPELPIVVSRLRFKLELAERGLLASVSALIAGLPGAEGDLARLYWAEATEFESDHPLVLSLAALLDPPLSAPEVRAMFVAARDREA